MIKRIELGTKEFSRLTFLPRNEEGEIRIKLQTEDYDAHITLTEEDELRLLKFFMKQ